MRLIDADKVVEALTLAFTRTGGEANRHFMNGIDTAVEVLNDAPTIEAEPVRHGIWLKNDLGQTYCSICKRQIPTVPQLYIEYGDFEEDTEIEETECCPNCGARMDGGKADGR